MLFSRQGDDLLEEDVRDSSGKKWTYRVEREMPRESIGFSSQTL